MTKIFSLKGKGLKFDTAGDVEAFLRDLIAMPDVEAIDISGNTWGIDAVKPFAEVLKKCKSIKVCPSHQFQQIEFNDPSRQSTSPICSLPGRSGNFQCRYKPYYMPLRTSQSLNWT
jgi:hypothetical protein